MLTTKQLKLHAILGVTLHMSATNIIRCMNNTGKMFQGAKLKYVKLKVEISEGVEVDVSLTGENELTLSTEGYYMVLVGEDTPIKILDEEQLDYTTEQQERTARHLALALKMITN